MKSMVIPSATATTGQEDLAEELPARLQVEQVVDGAERGGDGAAEQQRRDLRRLEAERDRRRRSALVDGQEDAGDQQEGGRTRPGRRPAGPGSC